MGHAGTLDPLATGVMTICTGRKTKEIEQLQYLTKEYIAEIMLGATTPSFDLETEVDAVYPTGHITREIVEECRSSLQAGLSRYHPLLGSEGRWQTGLRICPQERRD